MGSIRVLVLLSLLGALLVAAVPSMSQTVAGDATDQAPSGASRAPPVTSAPENKSGETISATAGATNDCRSTFVCPSSTWLADHEVCAITFAVVIFLIAVVTAIMLYFAGRSTATPYITTLSASFFFWLGIGYLLLLLVAAAMYVQVWMNPFPLLLGGVLPVGVPWFGALGAVVISLEGVFIHGREWDGNYNYWHIGRPLFGGVLGIVAFFTYVLIVVSSGSVPSFLEGKSPSTAPKDYIIYYVVAFLVGYREETFRELITRVTDLILKPGTASAASGNAPAIAFKSSGAAITKLDFGTSPIGTPVVIAIDIVNTGKAALLAPKATVDAAASSAFTVSKDPLSTGEDLKAGESRSIELTFKPTAAGLVASTLIISGSNLASTVRLSLSGKA